MFTAADVIDLQKGVRQVPTPDAIQAATADLARATRRGTGSETADATQWLQWGGGPGAGQMLVLAAIISLT